MPYCDSCGSYIPDGWSVCPACGYDKDKQAKQEQQAAAAQARMEQQAEAERVRQEEHAAKMREEAERRRAERQAYDKVWAENEQRRRREEEELRRRQQEQQEQEARRKQEQRRRSRDVGGVQVFVDSDGTKNVHVGDRVHVVVNPDGSKTVQVGGTAREAGESGPSGDAEVKFGKAGDKVRDFVNSDAVNKMEQTIEGAGGKVLPLLSYIGPLCFLSLILGSDHFTKFHAKQGLRLFICGTILQAVGGMFAVGWVFGILQILFAVIGIKNVINGEAKKLPYIGG